MCPKCKGSSVRSRPDVSRKSQFKQFLSWLLGNATQREIDGGTGRAFRQKHSWCWNVEPVLVITGEVYDEIQVDGTYLDDGWCLLTAVNGAGEIVNWQWCNQESTAAYQALLELLPAPRLVITDGGQGLASALGKVWPETKVQRCLVHVQRNIRRYTTITPRTDAGKGMYRLGCTLTKVKTPEQAIAWLKALEDWHQQHGHLLQEKTYASAGTIRPSEAKPGAEWWWTHLRLRKAYSLLSNLVKKKHLFTCLEPEFDGLNISAPTNILEGGTNAQIKDLLRRHRGMTSSHQRRAADWYCYTHSPKPKPPFIKPEHWQPIKPPTVVVQEAKLGDWGRRHTRLNPGLGARILYPQRLGRQSRITTPTRPKNPHVLAANLPLFSGTLGFVAGAFGEAWQFHGDFEWYGYYEMPLLAKQDPILDGLKLIRFSSIVKKETRDLDATVHFFEDDAKFDEVWAKPEPYLQELAQYRQVMTPDFSLYSNWPVPVQMFNTFRSRWCGWYWQQHGLTVIPTVSWALQDSYRFCFDGVPPCSTVAVSTVGCMDSEKGFMAGYKKMLKKLDPICVINYGEPFDAMDGLAPLIVVPYQRTTRVASRLS